MSALNRQVEIAQKIKSELKIWLASENALDWLSRNNTRFDLSDCLLKVSAVNSLYSTRVLDIGGMSEHVYAVLRKPENKIWIDTNLKLSPERNPNAAIELVKMVARRSLRSGRQYNFTSFASKFCHFFVDSDLFPILDSAAAEALENYGKYTRASSSYKDFYDAFNELKLGLTNAKTRELDAYLWIRGMLKRHDQNGRFLTTGEKFSVKPVNSEIKAYFEKHATAMDLTILRDEQVS